MFFIKFQFLGKQVPRYGRGIISSPPLEECPQGEVVREYKFWERKREQSIVPDVHKKQTHRNTRPVL